MRNYIELLMDSQSENDEILYSFFLYPMSRDQKREYNDYDLANPAKRLFSILKKTPTEHIIDIIEMHKREISEITTGSIPQFSKLTDVDRIPDIVISNPNCKYKLIGYFFNKNATDQSNQKYGENHYKLAAQLGICEHADKKASEGITAVSFLGYKYKDLPLNERDQIRPKLCLQVPFIQTILVEARHKEVDAMEKLHSLLTPSTSIRRRSSLQQMMHAIEETLTTDNYLIDNIKWGYSRNAK